MKVYVKKDKVLKLLGEGKVYSKKDLMLKEVDLKKITAVANPNGYDVSSSQALTNARKLANAGVGHISLDTNDLAGVAPSNVQNSNQSDSQLHMNLNKTTPSDIDKQLKNNNPNKPNEVVFDTDNANDGVYDHKTPRKVMDEMRANSVPFTKSELTEFLKNL